MAFQLFKQAKAQRNPRLANISYVELMSTAAEEAGHHLVYVENLQNTNKWQVRYTKPFSSAVVAELIIRMEGFILGFLRNRDYDPLTIDSHLAYGVWNFIKTYKPDVHTTDKSIVGALHNSIMHKVHQGNRKELFKYRPGYQGFSIKDREKMEEDPTYIPKERYVKTPKEISINTKIEGKDSDDNSSELGDYIADTFDGYQERDDMVDLELEFTSSSCQKIFLEILVEGGAHGKVSIKDLGRTALEYPSLVEEVRLELAEKKGCQPAEVSVEVLTNRVMKQAKIFYRNLRDTLAAKHSL